MKLLTAALKLLRTPDTVEPAGTRMPRVVLVCEHDSERRLLEACMEGCEVAKASSLKEMTRALATGLPEATVIWASPGELTSLEVLHLLRRSQMQVPVVMVLASPNPAMERLAYQMGVREFIRAPVRYKDVRRALGSLLKGPDAVQSDDERPICDFEARQNLSVLVETLNRTMKCGAGSNRVFLRSVIKGIGQKTRPRVCLRCPIRLALGLSGYVFFEQIRDYCAGDYLACEAAIRYRRSRGERE